MIFILPVMFLEAASFRADRPAQSVQDLNDVGWLMFIGVVTTAVLELIVIGIAILQDHGANPVFPRWAGYYSIWVALLLTPGSVTVFFKHGPLAWNGLLTWWLPLAVFATWLAVMTALPLRAIHAQALAEPAPTAALPGDVWAEVERLVAEAIERHRGVDVTTVI